MADLFHSPLLVTALLVTALFVFVSIVLWVLSWFDRVTHLKSMSEVCRSGGHRLFRYETREHGKVYSCYCRKHESTTNTKKPEPTSAAGPAPGSTEMHPSAAAPAKGNKKRAENDGG